MRPFPLPRHCQTHFAQALDGFRHGRHRGGDRLLPLGTRSGAHFNPAVTLTFLRLGKFAPWDAAFYVVFQFVGGLVGVLVSAPLLGKSLAAPGVDYIVTVAGPEGPAIAFLAGFTISFLLMTAVLVTSNSTRLAACTGWIVGTLLVIYVTVEAPLSGMSMNPARTLGSAVPARVWTASARVCQLEDRLDSIERHVTQAKEQANASWNSAAAALGRALRAVEMGGVKSWGTRIRT
jgi:Major intrinsic protein